jgi:hypothetical protein
VERRTEPHRNFKAPCFVQGSNFFLPLTALLGPKNSVILLRSVIEIMTLQSLLSAHGVFSGVFRKSVLRQLPKSLVATTNIRVASFIWRFVLCYAINQACYFGGNRRKPAFSGSSGKKHSENIIECLQGHKPTHPPAL